MKKTLAVVMVLVMVLAFSATAFAAGGPLTLELAKQAALNYAGVKASEATFTRAHQDWENGRQVYELEFFANNTEYDVDVDMNTGKITAFSTEFRGYTQPGYSARPSGNPQPGCYYGDDWDDLYDRDWDDMYDYDRFDRDFDDLYDWDD